MACRDRRFFSAATLGLILLGFGVSACGEGGGAGPTAPPPPTAAGSATVAGQVTAVSGAAASASLGASPAGVRPPSAVSGASASGLAVTVRIQGTDLSTATDAQGRFALGGVPAGSQVVLFESGSATAPLAIPDIQTGERIDLTVALQGSTVQVQSMSRSGEGAGTPSLTLELQPDTWNTNWAGSSGTVSALIRGEGLGDIDLGSIVLVGSDPAAAPLAPTRVDRAGDHVRAFFAKAEAIGALDDPQPDEVHLVTIELTVAGEPLTLTAEVRIVGPATGGAGAAVDLEKATNGQDADRPPGPTIPVGDPVEWTYVVTNTGDVPLSAVTVTDDQGVAVECRGDALEPGESMTCTGAGIAEPGQYSNLGLVEATTRAGETVGDEDPSHYFGEETRPGPVELSLEMQPDAWNTNWDGSSGTVSALIRGEGFEGVDLDSIVLIGTDPAAAPLAPTRAERQGNHVRAFFAKSEAIGVLDDPHSGERHTVTVELTVDGMPVTLSDEVRVVGPSG